jgi:hypothetical protein
VDGPSQVAVDSDETAEKNAIPSNSLHVSLRIVVLIVSSPSQECRHHQLPDTGTSSSPTTHPDGDNYTHILQVLGLRVKYEHIAIGQ